MPDARKQSTRGRYRWPLILAAALIGHAVAMIGAVTIAVSDASFAVEPEYYRKAVDWDARRAAQRRSAELGWTLTIVPSSVPDPQGRRLIICELTDGDGSPIAGAAITLTLFHHARAKEVQHAALTMRSPGQYQAVVPMAAAGMWRVEAEAVTSIATFVQSLDLHIASAEGGAP